MRGHIIDASFFCEGWEIKVGDADAVVAVDEDVALTKILGLN